MDAQTTILIITSVITGASIILKAIAPLTKTKKDDKILNILLKVMKILSIHTNEEDKVEVTIKTK